MCSRVHKYEHKYLNSLSFYMLYTFRISLRLKYCVDFDLELTSDEPFVTFFKIIVTGFLVFSYGLNPLLMTSP